MMATKRSVGKVALPDIRFSDSCVVDAHLDDSGKYEIVFSGFVRSPSSLKRRHDRFFLLKCLCVNVVLRFLASESLTGLFFDYLDKFKREGRI